MMRTGAVRSPTFSSNPVAHRSRTVYLRAVSPSLSHHAVAPQNRASATLCAPAKMARRPAGGAPAAPGRLCGRWMLACVGHTIDGRLLYVACARAEARRQGRWRKRIQNFFQARNTANVAHVKFQADVWYHVAAHVRGIVRRRGRGRTSCERAAALVCPICVTQECTQEGHQHGTRAVPARVHMWPKKTSVECVVLETAGDPWGAHVETVCHGTKRSPRRLRGR